MINWITTTFFFAALAHVFEEYVFPGGFPDFMRQSSPRFAPFITPVFAVGINGAFLALCLAAAWLGPRQAVFSLSVAGVCGMNGLVHAGGVLRARRYAPGLLTGVALYLPLAGTAYLLFLRKGLVTEKEAAGALLLGAAYQAVPVAALSLASMIRKPGDHTASQGDRDGIL